MTPEILLDYNDLKSGFQVGRAAALADWQARREDAAFEKLVSRLRYQKWVKARRDVRRASARRYNEKPSSRAAAVERTRRWVLAQKKKRGPDATVYRCSAPDCGATWCRVPGLRGSPARWCSSTCVSRTRRREAKAAAGLPVVTRRRAA